jgi:predicted RNA binding protein YcfA (HicA-like mRNA interferase family)
MNGPARESFLPANAIAPRFLTKWYNGLSGVPRKVRELLKDLRGAGFTLVPGAGKGSHRKLTHAKFSGAVTLSGRDGDDAKQYQEKQIKRAIEEVNR